MIILWIVWAHIVFSLFNMIFYEIVKNIYGYRIIANGWRKTETYRDHEERAAVDPKYVQMVNILSNLIMFIPILNIETTIDLINMIRYTPEQMKEEGGDPPMD